MLFNQLLGKQYQAQQLGPLGNDISNYLPPLALRIKRGEQYRPAYSCKNQKNAQRVPPQMLADVPWKTFRGLPVLGGSDFVEILCTDHVMTTPLQSAIAFPKKEPRCVSAFEWR